MALNFTSNLKNIRKRRDITQEGLGLQMDKARNTINNWEKGVSEPSLAEIEKLCNILDVSVAELLFSDVQISENEKVEKMDQNVQGNVQGSVQVTGKRGSKPAPPDAEFFIDMKRMHELERNNKALAQAVDALTTSNAILARDIAKLESIIRLEKTGIPVVGATGEKSHRKTAG